jgi:hypothetical protein
MAKDSSGGRRQDPAYEVRYEVKKIGKLKAKVKRGEKGGTVRASLQDVFWAGRGTAAKRT